MYVRVDFRDEDEYVFIRCVSFYGISSPDWLFDRICVSAKLIHPDLHVHLT